MEYEDDGNTNCNWHTWDGPQRFGKGTGRVGNQRKNQDHPIVEISPNTQNSPGDLRRLAVTQTPEKTHQLMVVGKACRKYDVNILRCIKTI